MTSGQLNDVASLVEKKVADESAGQHKVGRQVDILALAPSRGRMYVI
jgi:hypothetical protein